jgi:peroxiredoxin
VRARARVRAACRRRRRAEKDLFKRSNIAVVAISPDGVADQKAFKDKHNLSVRAPPARRAPRLT